MRSAFILVLLCSCTEPVAFSFDGGASDARIGDDSSVTVDAGRGDAGSGGDDAGGDDAGGDDAGGGDAGGDDAGGDDAGGDDAGGDDAGGDDAGLMDGSMDAGTDTGSIDGGGGDPCTFPSPDTSEEIDFATFDVRSLNQGNNASTIQTVFELDTNQMRQVTLGARLAVDVREGPFDYTFRAEFREQNISTHPALGTTQVYRQRFDVELLPDPEGPITIFQRFNRDNDGPDIEVEMTGARQFGDAVAGELQVVAFGDRRRIRGRSLADENELLVMVYNHQSNGYYRVSLNGEVLAEARNIDTAASTRGSWYQFGIYPHGLQDSGNRGRQTDPVFAFIYHWATKWEYEREADPSLFGTVDPATGRCGL